MGNIFPYNISYHQDRNGGRQENSLELKIVRGSYTPVHFIGSFPSSMCNDIDNRDGQKAWQTTATSAIGRCSTVTTSTSSGL